MEVGVGQWSATLLIEGRGINVETAGRWVGVYWGAFTVGRILFGLFDRYNVRLVIRLAPREDFDERPSAIAARMADGKA